MPNTLSEWIATVSTIVLLLFGGGGVAAFFKQRQDSRNGVRQENRADVEALNVRAVAMIETQFNYLVKPLQGRIDSQEQELGAFRVEVKNLEREVRLHRNLYLTALEHIRTLYSWILRHMPSHILDDTEIPKPPQVLKEDLHEHNPDGRANERITDDNASASR